MIAVSDTSPINYLVLIDCVHVMPVLFERVLVPQAVFAELSSVGAPSKIHQWLASSPVWFKIHSCRSTDPELLRLDPGECEAILLAESLKADLLLLDENLGRQTARQRNLSVTGTLGLLDRAATRGLIDLSTALDRLSHTNFRVSPKLLQQLKP